MVNKRSDPLPPVAKPFELWTEPELERERKPELPGFVSISRGKIHMYAPASNSSSSGNKACKYVCSYTCRILSGCCSATTLRPYWWWHIGCCVCQGLFLLRSIVISHAAACSAPALSFCSVTLCRVCFTSCFTLTFHCIPPHSCISPPETQEHIPNKQCVPPRGPLWDIRSGVFYFSRKTFLFEGLGFNEKHEKVNCIKAALSAGWPYVCAFLLCYDM